MVAQKLNSSLLGLALTLISTPTFAQYTDDMIEVGSQTQVHTQIQSDQSDWGPTITDGSKLGVKWDCYLQYSHFTSCEELANAYFNYYPYFEQQNKNTNQDHYLTITLTDAPVKDGVRYHYKVTPGTGNNGPELKFDSDLSDSEQSSIKRQTIIANLVQFTAPYVNVISVEKNPKGNVVATMGDPRGKNAPPVNDDSKNWYLDTNLNGNSDGQSSGSKIQTANFGATYTYAKDKGNWKFKANSNAKYRHMEVPYENGQVFSVQTFEYNGSILIVRSISDNKRWNIAVLLSESHKPTSNLKQNEEAGIGVEWTLVPFRTTESKSLFFRYGIGIENQVYFTPNVLDRMSDKFLGHTMMLYWGWHFDKARTDVSVYGGASSPMRDHSYAQLFAGGNVKINITNNITLKLYGNIHYREKSLTEPKEIDYSNPIATQYAGGLSGFSYSTGVSISFSIGNSQKVNQDLRWQDF